MTERAAAGMWLADAAKTALSVISGRRLSLAVLPHMRRKPR
jgi:hypothetical protein